MGLVFIDISMACDLSFYWGKSMEISIFHFRTMVQGGYFFSFFFLTFFFVNSYRTYEQGLVIIDNHGM